MCCSVLFFSFGFLQSAVGIISNICTVPISPALCNSCAKIINNSSVANSDQIQIGLYIFQTSLSRQHRKYTVEFHFLLEPILMSSVAYPDPVGSGPFWSDPGVWDRIPIRIRILALINDPISIFLICVKTINTSGISVV
jgi:hypothetical protein